MSDQMIACQRPSEPFKDHWHRQLMNLTNKQPHCSRHNNYNKVLMMDCQLIDTAIAVCDESVTSNGIHGFKDH